MRGFVLFYGVRGIIESLMGPREPIVRQGSMFSFECRFLKSFVVIHLVLFYSIWNSFLLLGSICGLGFLDVLVFFSMKAWFLI